MKEEERGKKGRGGAQRKEWESRGKREKGGGKLQGGKTRSHIKTHGVRWGLGEVGGQRIDSDPISSLFP